MTYHTGLYIEESWYKQQDYEGLIIDNLLSPGYNIVHTKYRNNKLLVKYLITISLISRYISHVIYIIVQARFKMQILSFDKNARRVSAYQ